MLTLSISIHRLSPVMKSINWKMNRLGDVSLKPPMSVVPSSAGETKDAQMTSLRTTPSRPSEGSWDSNTACLRSSMHLGRLILTTLATLPLAVLGGRKKTLAWPPLPMGWDPERDGKRSEMISEAA